MIVHKYPDCDELSESEIEEVDKVLNADEIWYQYDIGYYDGNGVLLARRGEGFMLFDIGHCSCYGPVDNIEIGTKKWEDFDALVNRVSESYAKCVGPLLNFARRT